MSLKKEAFKVVQLKIQRTRWNIVNILNGGNRQLKMLRDDIPKTSGVIPGRIKLHLSVIKAEDKAEAPCIHAC